MRRWLLVLFFLLFAARLEAQPAPTIVSTLQSTDTSTTSIKVGCAIGSGTCTGGIVAGPLSVGPVAISSGYVEIQSFVPASQTNRLVNNSGTLQWNGSTLAIGGSISGAVNTIPVFTASNAIGNSIMTQSGTTITVANTLSATTLTGTLSTASQPNVTGVGTITTGTWNATKIGLLYGGTNADLSGTGGTSQFLRQNALGAAITVVRPAVADLSDNSNIFLLNANNTVTATGVQTFGPGGTGTGARITINGSSGSGSGADVLFQRAGVNEFQIGTHSSVIGGTASDTALLAAGALEFYTNGSALKWGINTAGDFTFGASNHIADSSGTPTITAGGGTGGTVTGVDYAFFVTFGTGSPASVDLDFGHAFSSAPVCIPYRQTTPTNLATIVSLTTSHIQISETGGTYANGEKVFVFCRGF